VTDSKLFDPAGPLPGHRLAVEASAGTGKTYTLAALITRFVAEHDVPVGQLLVVTFTRAATSELRDRVRDRLVRAAEHLRAGCPPVDDPVLCAVADADEQERDRRLRRLETAVTDFDAATITTIHGFAAQVLGVVGPMVGLDLDATLVDDERELIEAVCADVLGTAAVSPDVEADLPDLATLSALTARVLAAPDLLVLPRPDDREADGRHHLCRSLVEESVSRIRAHRTRAGTRSFDDLLSVLQDALRGSDHSVIGVLRERYRVALIDEFQDTDPVQWEIFRTVFSPEGDTDGQRTLVVVGDPKQAIYAFRGADVRTYLSALAEQAELRSLATNWRSDGAVLAALERLFSGVTFGDHRIGFTPVQAAEDHRHQRLRESGTDRALPALALRFASGADLERDRTGRKVKVPVAFDAICRDLGAQAQQLLEAARLPGPVERPVRPSDIAVLVRTGSEAIQVQRALVARGIPAVLARGGSVLTSPAAIQWRWLLEGLARPADPTRARTAALSWFVGWSADRLANATDSDLADVQDLLSRWAEDLALGGVSGLIRRVWADSGVVERVLARPDGDRELTDIEHLAELLRSEATGSASSVASLLAVLDTDPVSEADADLDQDLASRRIETEAEAVQVMTVWVSKGLEFPIVLCPSLWRKPGAFEVVFQEAATGRRALDVVSRKDSCHTEEADREQAGELLRLLYVALTRARHQVVLWWATCKDSEDTGLAHVLFARAPDGSIDPVAFERPKVDLPEDPVGALSWLVDGDLVTAGHHGEALDGGPRWSPEVPPRAELAVAELAGPPLRRSSRWSFTAITAGVATHDAPPPRLDLPEAAGGTDEGAEVTAGLSEGPAPTGPAPAPTDPPQLPFAAVAVLPLASLPAGADFGILVHEVLEVVDFTAPDLDAALADALDERLARRSFDLTPVGDPAGSPAAGRRLLIDGLAATVDTPLGPSFAGLRLRDLARADRLDELSFDLHLARPGQEPTVPDLAEVVLDHLDPRDPYRPWAESLRGSGRTVGLAGHLTGSIDLVARVRGPQGDRFVVVDYKTNRLHPPGTVPAGHYRPDLLVDAMAHHHYPLQALLYQVALHRFLRWRLGDGYRPETHLGGAAYLFVRGLAGPTTPVVDGTPHGVASWAVPPGLVTALSDLLAGPAGPTDPTGVVR
jgi:exodeoxyribonuclease V beta subunit